MRRLAAEVFGTFALVFGGGWLIWKWLRDDRPTWWGLLGGVVLKALDLGP